MDVPCRPLRELANLVLIMGNRDKIGEMAPGSQAVMLSILRAVSGGRGERGGKRREGGGGGRASHLGRDL